MPATVIYNKIGKGYNTTRRADPYITDRLWALLHTPTSGVYVDIGCGTGNYTVKLAERGLNMTGIDPSETMLKEAGGKSTKVKWINGTVESIPLPDASADGGMATLTLHHWTDHAKAFLEIARILKPGALFVIFTFTPEQEKGYWFNHFFPQMMQRGMARSLSLESLKAIAESAGLALAGTEKYFVQDDLQDMFGYSGKNDPERYFDPEVVHGISYFSIYADDAEKQDGFRKLRESIDSGEFETIKRKYENDLGDYLFVLLQKQ